MDRRNSRETRIRFLLPGLTLVVCCAACDPGTEARVPRMDYLEMREAIQSVEDGSAPWEQRLEAVCTLRKMGPAAAEAVAVLIRALGDGDCEVRRAAAQALGEIGSEKGVIPALTQALRDEDYKVRSAAVEALGEIGPQAVEAVPTLVQLLRDEDTRARSEIVGVLGRIGPKDDLVPVLIQILLEDKDPEVRAHASVVLRHMGQPEDIVPIFIQVMADEPGMRWVIAEGLWKIGPEAMEAVPVLIQALEDECASEFEAACDVERHAIIRALRAITGQDFAEDTYAWQEWWEEQQ